MTCQFINPHNLNTNYLLKIFFIIVLVELFIMGSGRFIEVGALSLRMIFFGIMLFGSIFLLFFINKVKIYIKWFVVIFLTLTITSVFNGLVNEAELSYVLEDIKPLLFFLMIIPFSLYINSYSSIILVSKLVKVSGLIMCFLFFLFIFLMYFGYVDFQTMYKLLSSDSNDIMFRGSNNEEVGLFYKGFLYLNIAFIFFIFSNEKKEKVIAFLLLIAIFLTFTRGFLLALLISFTIFFIIDIKNKKSFYSLIILVIGALILIPIYLSLIGDRSVSDITRIIQINQVLDKINLTSFFIGHGFGVGVPIRPIHMEIAYLEVFHKQGLIGLFFWFSIILFILYNYLTIKNKNHNAKSFLVGAIFVFAQSLTNPFLNNPIGLAFILISMIALYELKKIDLKYSE